jgi:sigma-E factor negative regulatory protein RseC
MIDLIERHGEVIGFKQGVAQIRIERASSACGGCGNRGTCASGSTTVQNLEMVLPAGAKVGDQVTVSMPSSSITQAAILGYLLPPVLLLLGAISADLVYGSDFAAVLGAVSGLVFGLLLARLVSHLALGKGISPSACSSDLPTDSPFGELP